MELKKKTAKNKNKNCGACTPSSSDDPKNWNQIMIKLSSLILNILQLTWPKCTVIHVPVVQYLRQLFK